MIFQVVYQPIPSLFIERSGAHFTNKFSLQIHIHQKYFTSIISHQITTKFLTCHNNAAVAICIKFWINHCIKFYTRPKHKFYFIRARFKSEMNPWPGKALWWSSDRLTTTLYETRTWGYFHYSLDPDGSQIWVLFHQTILTHDWNSVRIIFILYSYSDDPIRS